MTQIKADKDKTLLLIFLKPYICFNLRHLRMTLFSFPPSLVGRPSDQPRDDAAVVDDLDRAALGGEELVAGVDAEAVVDRGGEVLGAVRVVGGPLGAAVGAADHDPAP